MKVFWLLMAGVMVASPALAQTAPSAPIMKAMADLNGDGKADTISATSAPRSNKFTLSVNGIKRVVSHEDAFEDFEGFRILALSGDSKRRYIAVTLRGANDYNQNHFFLFDGKAIRPAGVVPGEFSAPGNGAVYVQEWLGFWMCFTKYAVTPSGVLQYVPQPGYYVGQPGTVKTTFPIRATPSRTGAVVANVAPKSKIQVVLFQPSGKMPTDPSAGYYLIKTETGLCGWTEFKPLNDKVANLPFAG